MRSWGNERAEIIDYNVYVSKNLAAESAGGCQREVLPAPGFSS